MSLREMFKPCGREDGCGGYICLFHSLRPEVQEYITQLLAGLKEAIKVAKIVDLDERHERVKTLLAEDGE